MNGHEQKKRPKKVLGATQAKQMIIWSMGCSILTVDAFFEYLSGAVPVNSVQKCCTGVNE